MEREKPRSQEFYRHFNNRLYQIITVAKHSETGEELVVYQALYGNFPIYARPLDMFMSEVDKKKYPDALQKYRFEKVEFEKPISDTKKASSQKKPEPKKEDDSQKEILQQKEMDSDSQQKALQPEGTEAGKELPNPDLLEFLDADTMEQKRRILIGMRDRITNRLIDDIAASLDVTIGKGEVSERYKSLMVCVDTIERFEVNRLR